jgi:hypothetical protein
MHVKVIKLQGQGLIATRESSNLITLIWMRGTVFLPQASSLFNTLVAFPALYRCPLSANSFVKHINLTSNQQVKMGRQTNTRTVPAQNNGYFDSKVLSRQHAEVWEENFKGQCSLCRSELRISDILIFFIYLYQGR